MDMSLDKLAGELLRHTEQEVREIEAEAAAEATAILEDARANAKARVDALKKLAQDEAERKHVDVYAARIRAKKIEAEAREDAVQRVLDGVRDELRRFAASREYPAALGRLAKEALRETGEGSVLYGRKADEKLLGQWAKFAGALDCTGGCVAVSADGRLRADNTLDARLREREADLKERAYRALFPRAAKKPAVAPMKPTGRPEAKPAAKPREKKPVAKTAANAPAKAGRKRK